MGCGRLWFVGCLGVGGEGCVVDDGVVDVVVGRSGHLLIGLLLVEFWAREGKGINRAN